MEHHGDLLTGNGIIGTKASAAVTGDDADPGCPRNSIRVLGSSGDINKIRLLFCFGLLTQLVQSENQFTTGHGAVAHLSRSSRNRDQTNGQDQRQKQSDPFRKLFPHIFGSSCHNL